MNKASPFPTATRKTHKVMSHIDPELLKIGNDPYTGQRSSPEGKYDAIFAAMKPGQSIECEPSEAGSLRNALHKWLQARKKDDVLEVRMQTRYHKDGRGRVWLLSKEQKLKRAA